LTSDFEAGLLPELKEAIPDLVSEAKLSGLGKDWVANLYSATQGIVIEACSRNVVRTGKTKSSIQHYEKFYSMLLKLIDIKAKHPAFKPLMLWKNLIPAHSTDLALCSSWGVYVLSHEDFRIRDVIEGSSASTVNRKSVSYLIRRGDPSVTPRWRWLAGERKGEIVALLEKRAIGSIEIGNAIGLRHRGTVARLLRELEKSGSIHRLEPGYARGVGAIYGVSESQLGDAEKMIFKSYGQQRRKNRISQRTVELLEDEGPLGYMQIRRRLEERWGFTVSRESLVGILSKSLVRKGLVNAAGAPKRRIYSFGRS